MNEHNFVRKWTAFLLAVCLVLGTTGHVFGAECDTAQAEKPGSDCSLEKNSGMGKIQIKASGTIANLDYNFTTIGGDTVSTRADGKLKVLIFYKPGCGNCRSVLNILKSNSTDPALDRADIYAVDIIGTELEDVKSFYNTYGTEKVTFCYDTGYQAQSAMWQYVSDLGIGNSITTPLAVFINSDNEIVYYSTGMNRNILSDISKYLDSDSSEGSENNSAGSQETYTIRYYLRGGKNNSKNPTAYTAASAFVLRSPVKKGHAFAGWYSDIQCKKRVTEIKKGTRGNKTLYAKWTPNRYTVKFSGNGATKGKMSVMKTCRYGKVCRLSTNKYKKKGYRFAGWNTKKNGKGKTYKNRAQVKNLTAKKNGTVTLYAQWKKK